MSLWGRQRRKKSRQYEILIIPKGDGGSTTSIKANLVKISLWGGGIVLGFFLIFLLAFRFTPLGALVGIDASSLEATRRAQEETQRRIRSLAEEIAVVKDYNWQLRKALGEGADKEPAHQPKGESLPEHAEKLPPVQSHEVEIEDLGEPFVAPKQGLPTYGTQGLRANFPLLVPVAGVLTQGFEPDQKHFGVDYAAKQGTPIYAAAQGYVVFSGWTYDDGNMVILSHGSGYITVYKHNSSLLKPTGSLVRRGELIGLVGSTGETSKGPHLHFEVLKDGVPQDPQRFLLGTTTS